MATEKEFSAAHRARLEAEFNETPITRARRLTQEAARACHALVHSLPLAQGYDCAELIGYACDQIYSAEGYLETVARRLAGDEKMPVPLKIDPALRPEQEQAMREALESSGLTATLPGERR
jgi:hypothetical protein